MNPDHVAGAARVSTVHRWHNPRTHMNLHMPGGLLFAGDMMERMTNGQALNMNMGQSRETGEWDFCLAGQGLGSPGLLGSKQPA